MPDDIITIAVVSDLHINSSVALSIPSVTLDDGDKIHSRRARRWLWQCWLDYCERFGKLPGRKIVVFNGDLGELDTKRRSVQLLSADKATILAMIRDTIAPLVDQADTIYLTRGTPAHVGKSAWLEEEIGADLDATGPTEKQHSWYHLEREANGHRLSIAHHASMSRAEQTKLNAPARLAVELELAYHRAGQRLPGVAIRSHNHRWADTHDNFPVRVVYTPSWSLATEYISRTGNYTADMLAEIGGLFLVCRRGEPLEVIKAKYAPERRQIWKAM